MSEQPKQSIKSYGAGIRARTEERRAAEKAQGPVFPNLAQAQVAYDAKDGAQTLQQIAAEQRQNDAPKQPGLSPQTVAGMSAVFEHAQKAQATLPPPAAPEGPQEPRGGQGTAPGTQELSSDDFELSAALRMMQQDVLQNDKERKAVAGRCKPLDLGAGIMSGEFTQDVPVVPDTLVVRYRSLSVLEHQALRLYLFDAIRENSALDQINGELMGLYQTVASVAAVNGQAFGNSHLKRQTNGTLEFLKDEFTEKLQKLQAMPLQLLHAIGVHGSWFDGRVRELFVTADPLKNG